jgi:hypothetical protein
MSAARRMNFEYPTERLSRLYLGDKKDWTERTKSVTPSRVTLHTSDNAAQLEFGGMYGLPRALCLLTRYLVDTVTLFDKGVDMRKSIMEVPTKQGIKT